MHGSLVPEEKRLTGVSLPATSTEVVLWPAMSRRDGGVATTNLDMALQVALAHEHSPAVGARSIRSFSILLTLSTIPTPPSIQELSADARNEGILLCRKGSLSGTARIGNSSAISFVP